MFRRNLKKRLEKVFFSVTLMDFLSCRLIEKTWEQKQVCVKKEKTTFNTNRKNKIANQVDWQKKHLFFNFVLLSERLPKTYFVELLFCIDRERVPESHPFYCPWQCKNTSDENCNKYITFLASLRNFGVFLLLPGTI